MTDGLDRDRFRGALLGLAAGDAVGTTLEFERPGQFEPIDDMVGGGPFGLEPGQWTDDTSMALCLAESIVQCEGRLDPADQLARYVRWWREGHLSSTGVCFDIGTTTSAALARWERDATVVDAVVDQDRAANGSLMRLAPVPMRWAADPRLAGERSAESSRTTHPAQRPMDACRVLGTMIAVAIGGGSEQDILDPARFEAVDLHPAIRAVVDGSYRSQEPPAIRGTGYCVDALEAALWAFDGSNSYREAVLAAANLGDDADTTAAICGQLAGAYWGASGIPARWLDQLALRETIDALANGLWELAQPAS